VSSSSKYRCAIGSLWLLTPLSMLFLFGAPFGMLLSIITKSQLLASQLGIVTTIFPAFLLSGFIFPIESMPLPVQWLTLLNPLRYYMVAIRGIFLKGVGIGILWPQLAGLAAIGLVLLSVAVARFRKTVG